MDCRDWRLARDAAAGQIILEARPSTKRSTGLDCTTRAERAKAGRVQRSRGHPGCQTRGQEFRFTVGGCWICCDVTLVATSDVRISSPALPHLTACSSTAAWTVKSATIVAPIYT
jgi:hypothetical protein